MRIIVLPKSKAKEFTCDKPWAAISISTIKAEFAKLNACQRLDLLQLYFADTNSDTSEIDPESCYFSPQHAHQILDFVILNKDKIETLLIHCEAGVSRSPAIAAAIHRIFINQENSIYFKNYTPNSRVFNEILYAAVLRGYIK